MAKKRSKQPTLDYGRGGPRDSRTILRWGAAILCGFVLWLVMVLAYAGPMAVVAASCLIVDGGVVIAWLVGAVGIGVWLLPVFAKRDGQPVNWVLRFATAAALGLGAISLLVLALGLLGWLNQIVAVATVLVGVTGALLRVRRTSPGMEKIQQWLAQPAGWGWLLLVVVPLAAVMTVGAMMAPEVLWSPQEPHGYDVVEYHLQVPREWFEAGRIIPLHHNVFSFFPFNVEMHYLLAMHLRGGPWAGMYAAQFMHGVFILLTVLAVGGIAGEMFKSSGGGRRSKSGPLVAMLAMAGAPLIWQLGAIAYDEGGFLLFGTLAIGWAIVAARHGQVKTGLWAIAGVMAGLACGAKLTAVPEVLVAVAVVGGIILLVSKASVLRAAAAVTTFGLCGLISFSPWLIRTWVWAGNPVFPELPQLGRGYFSQVQVDRWHHAHAARHDQQSLVGRARAAWTEVLANWQYGFLLVPLAILGAGIGWRERDVWFLGAILFLLALFWLGFTHVQGRFFVFGIPVCALLVSRLPVRAAFVAVGLEVIAAIVLINVQFLTPARVLVLHELLGVEDLSWLTPSVAASVPANAALTLVGDARAFVYQRPMSLLTYKTIFDADTTNGDVISAWAGPPSNNGQQCLLIDPVELERFAKTYPPFPALPAEVLEHNEPYVVRR